MDPTCVYCKLPKAAHGDAGVGPLWFVCPDGTGRPVHLDTHFRRPAPALTDDAARRLLVAVDKVARNADRHEYGLPFHEPHYGRMVEAVRAAMVGATA